MTSPHQVAQKAHIIGSLGRSAQFHTHLFRPALAFFIVTSGTGTHHIFPCRGPAPSARNHVVYRQFAIVATTVLTLVSISLKNIALGQHDSSPRRVNITLQTHDTRHGKLLRYGAHDRFQFLHRLCFAAHNEQHSAPHTTYAKRFVVLIED